MSYSSIFKDLLNFEKVIKPFKWIYKEIPVWLYLRDKFFILLLSERDTFQEKEHKLVNLKNKITFLVLSTFLTIKNIILGNIKTLKKDIVIFSSQDEWRGKINNKPVNIFHFPLSRMKNVCYFIIPAYFRRLNIKEKNKYVGYEFIILLSLSNLFSFFFFPLVLTKLFLYKERSKIWKWLKRKKYSTRIWKSLLKNEVKIYFKIKFFLPYLNALLHFIKPKVIVATSPDLLSFVANKNLISLVELQHGYIGKWNTFFWKLNKKERKQIRKVFPKYFLTWGKYFNNVIEHSDFSKIVKVLPLGYPWLSYNLRNVKKIGKKNIIRKIERILGARIKNKKILLITSQYTIQKFLIEKLKETKIPNDWIIIIKPHPYEKFPRLIYKEVLEMFPLKLFILTDEQISLYELLSISNAHLSCSSSVLLEAPAFGVSNYFLISKHSELMKDLKEFGIAKPVKNIQDAFSCSFHPNKKNLRKFFANIENSDKEIVKFILSLAK